LRLRNLDGTATSEPVPDLEAVLAFLTRHSRFRVAFDAKEIDVAAVGRRVLSAGVHSSDRPDLLVPLVISAPSGSSR